MLSVVSAVVALASLSAAQTFTSCNPLQKTCPADPALGKSITVDFTKGADSNFSPLPGTTLKYGSSGAEFTINTDSDAPTIESNWYIMFGRVDVVMQASPGVGVVSSVVLQSDDLDEVDWEWLGGDTAQVQTNYFGKGDTTTYDRGGFAKVANPQTTTHKYSFDWNAQRINWLIDDVVVRTLNYADAQGGSRYPQTPCRVKIGSWDAGSPKQPIGTQQWAGGLTDFSQAPFVMKIQSVSVSDGTTGAGEYVYSDNSGSYQSIKAQGSSSNNQPSGSTSLVVVSSTVASSAASSSSKAASTSSTSIVALTTSTKAAASSTSVASTLVTVTASSSTIATSAPVTTSAPTSSVIVASATTSAPTSTSTHNAAPTHAPGHVAAAALAVALGYAMI